MRNIISIISLGILVSFFFYPMGFTFLPVLNTKKLLAAIGIVIYTYKMFRRKEEKLSKDLMSSTLFAFVFSFCCCFSAVYFGTDDFAYGTYFVSFFVWLFGAYSVIFFLRKKYGKVDLLLITYYLGAVALAQCILAQIIDSSPAFSHFVDLLFSFEQEFVRDHNRIYGLGAALDSGGVRFSITLILLSYSIVEIGKSSKNSKMLWVLYSEFILISVLGNMIARTATVGMLLGLAYLLFNLIGRNILRIKKSNIRSIVILAISLCVFIPLFIHLYKTNSQASEDLRFAFEGFFNWVETGDFRTDSTDKLARTMVVWPKNSEGWWIGTGKFDNWAYGTDIGYCRFILYCGVIGFSFFVFFFLHNALSVSRKYEDAKLLSLMLFALTLIIWVKVSTDIFQIYALLFCADGTKQLCEKRQ